MPGEYPDTNKPRWVKRQYRHAHATRARAIVLGLLTTSSIFLMITTAAMANAGLTPFSASSLLGLFEAPFASFEITMLAVFGGAMSFALLSASWLIRERSKMSQENAALKARLTDLRASQDQMSALLNSADQLTVVWNGTEERPEMLGRLSGVTGVPEQRNEFLGFGTWLAPDSAKQFEGALKELRLNAIGFNLTLQSNEGSMLEAQGKTSGGFAFVRFIEMGSTQTKLAKLSSEHERIVSLFASLQGLFDHLDMPIWLKNHAGNLTWVNQAYSNAVDAANAAEAIEKDLQLFDSSQREEIAVGHKRSEFFSGRLPAVVSGDRHFLDVVDVKVENGGAGLAIDKSEVEEIRAKLQKTISSNAKMLDHLSTAVAIFNASKHLEFYNTSFMTLWQLDQAFLERNPSHTEVLDAMRAGSKLPEQSDWRKWRDSQTSVYQAMEPVEDRWHLPGGTTLRVVISPQEQGGIFWTCENMTEQLTLESNYKTLVKVQGETLDHLNEAVAVFGSDGRLKLSNPAFVKMVAGKNELAINAVQQGQHIRKVFEFFSNKLVDHSLIQQFIEIITGFEDKRNNREGRVELLDDKVVDYVLVPLPNGQTLITLFDRTDSVNVERALHERAEAFEASDLLKTRFIQHVSYELRAPLTNISGFGEMLHQEIVGPLSEKQHEYVDHINESSDALKAVVDDILDLATVDAGAMDLNVTTLDVGQAIAASIENLQSEIDSRKVQVAIDVAAGGETMIADTERLGQILFNLVSNAIEACPDAGKIQIQSRSVGNDIEISVSDSGKGVPAELRNLIFSRFESVASNNHRKGAGLGLSIVQSFVQLHGGTVHVGDADIGGARFICRFPKEPVHLLDAAQ